MGKKRTHAETKDGFTKPPPDKSRLSAKHDKKDKRKNGETRSHKNALVRVAHRNHDGR
jgi:ribosome biogenesis protein MAK21